MNVCILSGLAVKNNEIKTAGADYKFIKFSIGVQKNKKKPEGGWERETMWVNATASGLNAEIVDGFPKGTKAVFEGRLDISTYEKDGKKQYYTSLVVNKISDIVKKQDATQAPLEQLDLTLTPKTSSVQANPDFAGDDIPF